MIQVHVDILQNLQQAMFVLNLPVTAECSIQTDQVVIEDKSHAERTIIHFNGLIIDVNRNTEITTPEKNTITTVEEEQIRRTFRFPFLRLPIVTDDVHYDLTKIQCAECHTPLKIIPDNQSYKIVQQQSTNADDINEVIFCHRFCEAHQHEHTHEHKHQLHVPLDLHSESVVLETVESFVIGKEFTSFDLVNNGLVQCHHCSAQLGTFDSQTDLVSFDKYALYPFSNDYLSACFRHQEPGRYIVKVPKVNDSVFLVWILPNRLLSAGTSIKSNNGSIQLNFQQKRKILFSHITSADDKLFADWKRDFSVTTLLISRLCLNHLSATFKQELEHFPNIFNSKETFQSLTISL
ncbi:unnamed protein product [Adineta ricciae]|uniref:HECT-type E3 ubiquitin transferase E3D n=1 Tax=Adineta ricciae TaxID=249248 RepID=A0A814P1Y0_ADIRI|nr:unnamed protein product [Adineta ricciae]